MCVLQDKLSELRATADSALETEQTLDTTDMTGLELELEALESDHEQEEEEDRREEKMDQLDLEQVMGILILE
jgi:anti-sigma28 factor (negative regulator of flagellin synthesis)